MMTINVYLNFNGNCKEAFDFYLKCFGGAFSNVNLMSEGPAEMPRPDGWENKIMHISLPINAEFTLMGCDSNTAVSSPNTFSLSISPKTKDEADQLFANLSNGGTVLMPMADTFWNAYFGMFVDKFGVSWVINYEL